jgi:hypothetical protein
MKTLKFLHLALQLGRKIALPAPLFCLGTIVHPPLSKIEAKKTHCTTDCCRGRKWVCQVDLFLLQRTNMILVKKQFLVSRGIRARHFRSDTQRPVRQRHTNAPNPGRLGPTWQQATPIQYPARRRRLPVFSSRSSVLGDRLATSSYRCAGTHGFHASRGCLLPTRKDQIKPKRAFLKRREEHPS